MNTEALERLEAFGVLANGLAHDVRSPLNTIRFSAFTLRHALTHPERVNGKAAAVVQRIAEEVERLDGILRDFVRLARPESPRTEPVDVGGLLASVVRLAEGPCRSQNVELSWSCSRPVAVAADPDQLRQVLLNLVLNARQAMPRGGRIHLCDAPAGDHEALEVADTGPGIPDDVRARMFQPFFTTRKEGTGLGLSLCQALVERMNGRLEVRTEVGRGTTFVVRLPRADREPR